VPQTGREGCLEGRLVHAGEGLTSICRLKLRAYHVSINEQRTSHHKTFKVLDLDKNSFTKYESK
jgi:hypothetical protein